MFISIHSNSIFNIQINQTIFKYQSHYAINILSYECIRAINRLWRASSTYSQMIPAGGRNLETRLLKFALTCHLSVPDFHSNQNRRAQSARARTSLILPDQWSMTFLIDHSKHTIVRMRSDMWLWDTHTHTRRERERQVA